VRGLVAIKFLAIGRILGPAPGGPRAPARPAPGRAALHDGLCEARTHLRKASSARF
jgi:hypothetical protein